MHEQVTGYNVSAIPMDSDRYPEYHHWTIKVEWTGRERWAVRRYGDVFCRTDGRRRIPRGIYEPTPSGRTDYFLRTYRFTLDEALALARRIAPKVVCMNKTAEQYAAWIDAQRAEREQPA